MLTFPVIFIVVIAAIILFMGMYILPQIHIILTSDAINLLKNLDVEVGY